KAKKEKVVFLVIGDPFGATTHADIYLRAVKEDIEVKVIHNTSIMNAIGEVGLELYRYGKTVSIPYWSKGYEPTSFLNGIKENSERGLHTLCLLDIKADEKKYMSVKEALELLEKAEELTPENRIESLTPVIGVARLGCPDQKIVSGKVEDLKKTDFGKPLHALIIPGRLHPVEEEMLERWSA
ncbi:diphthine synthase, partial [Candidatus Woesearchaeota archaeon]|nr:diphthine synthase [Candidatus Woesearchaeota archaeon]